MTRSPTPDEPPDEPPAPSRLSAASTPLALVGVGLAGVLAAAALASFWAAGLLLSVVLLGCGVARLVLPVAALGPLAVRSLWVDVSTCAVLGVSVAAFAVVAPGGLLG